MTRTLCLFGTYDPDAPRLRRLVAGWEALGGRVITVHADLWPEAGARAAMGTVPLGRLLAAQRALWGQREKVEAADVVLVPYPGHFDVPLARVVCRALKKPLIFDPFISLYDTAVVDRGLLAEGSAQARLVRLVDQVSMRLADRVLADTGPQAEYYAGLAGIPRKKLAVVPVGADESLFFAREPREASSATEVLFYGTMIPLHGIDTILAAARLLKDTPEIHFHLVGEGQVPLEQLLANDPIPSIRWTRRLPYGEIPALIASADLCLGIFGTSDKAARVVPHKVYEAAAMGKAIVTADTPAIRAAFPEGSLKLVPPGDPEALAEAIRELAVAPVRRSQLGAAARAQFQAAYTTPAIGGALARAIADTVQGKV